MLCLSPEIKALWRQLRKWTSDHNWEFLIIPKLQKLTKTKFNLLLNLELNFEKTRIYTASVISPSTHQPAVTFKGRNCHLYHCSDPSPNFLSLWASKVYQQKPNSFLSIKVHFQLLTAASPYPATSVSSRKKIDICCLGPGLGIYSRSHGINSPPDGEMCIYLWPETRPRFGRYLKICKDNMYLS